MPQLTEQKKAKNPLANTKKRANGRFHEDDVSKYAATVSAIPEMVYSYFRDFSNFPSFMKGIKEVSVTSYQRSHWVVELKNGLKAEWDADIVAERPGEMIAWQSVEGSEVETSGAVWFSPAPEGKGTVVGLLMDFKVPGGKATEILTKLTAEDPDSLAQINLKRLKALIETGEIATIEGQSSGREEGSEMIVVH